MQSMCYENFCFLCSIATLVATAIVKDSQTAISQSFEASPDDLLVEIAYSPVFSPSLQCAAMLLNVSLRRLVLALEEGNKNKEEVGVATESHPSSADVTSEETQELKVSQKNVCAKIQKRGNLEQKMIFESCTHTS